MTSIQRLIKVFDNFVAYKDIVEGREHGAKALKTLLIAVLLATLFPLLSNTLNAYLPRLN